MESREPFQVLTLWLLSFVEKNQTIVCMIIAQQTKFGSLRAQALIASFSGVKYGITMINS